MNIDYLSQLPVDLFIKQITYLPFDDVISVCKANKTLYNYCINSKYNIRWRNLINNTFDNIYNYQKYLEDIRKKLRLSEGIYNYLVYSHLVKLLDPITQLMIYYRQCDMNSFDSPHYNNIQRFLSLFLLGKKDKIRDYLPDNNYLPFINMLEGHKTDEMITTMVYEGSVEGVSMMLSEGVNIHPHHDDMIVASEWGHLEVVKYLVEHGADVHAEDDAALELASMNGYLKIVEYLTEKGANIHTEDDWALRHACQSGHLEVVRYLVEHGANVHAGDDEPIKWAIQQGHLNIVRYLVENGADVRVYPVRRGYALKWDSENKHVEVVRYLESAN